MKGYKTGLYIPTEDQLHLPSLPKKEGKERSFTDCLLHSWPFPTVYSPPRLCGIISITALPSTEEIKA